MRCLPTRTSLRRNWKQVVQAVPNTIAAALTRHAYYFVPLAIAETEETMVAPELYRRLWAIARCVTAMCNMTAPIASSSPPA